MHKCGEKLWEMHYTPNKNEDLDYLELSFYFDCINMGEFFNIWKVVDGWELSNITSFNPNY